jgi:hypothetical protein
MNTSQPFAPPKDVLELEMDTRYKADELRKDIVRLQGSDFLPFHYRLVVFSAKYRVGAGL